MAYAPLTINLGPLQAGLSLELRFYDLPSGDARSTVTTGFIEREDDAGNPTGSYFWTGTYPALTVGQSDVGFDVYAVGGATLLAYGSVDWPALIAQQTFESITLFGEAGSIEYTYTVKDLDATTPLKGAAVYVTSDIAGTVRSQTKLTDELGRVVFHLDPGNAYFWSSRYDRQFSNPDTQVVSV